MSHTVPTMLRFGTIPITPATTPPTSIGSRACGTTGISSRQATLAACDGRSDATLNPGGVRIGTAEIYRRVDTMAEIEESGCRSAVENDTRIVLFVKMAAGHELYDELRAHSQQDPQRGDAYNRRLLRRSPTSPTAAARSPNSPCAT